MKSAWAKAARDAADEVEDDELHVPQRVLDVVAEDPEEQHVGEDVQPVAVEELVGDRASTTRARRRPVRCRRSSTGITPSEAAVALNAARDCTDWTRKTSEVERDQPVGDVRKLDVLDRIAVVERQEHPPPAQPPSFLSSLYWPGHPEHVAPAVGVGDAGEDEEQVREAVEVAHHVGVGVGLDGHELDHQPLGAPHHGAGDVELGRRAASRRAGRSSSAARGRRCSGRSGARTSRSGRR